MDTSHTPSALILRWLEAQLPADSLQWFHTRRETLVSAFDRTLAFDALAAPA